MKKLYTYVLLAITILSANKLNAQVNVTDSLALVDLYNFTDGAHWKKNTNWLLKPVKQWYGITVENNRVTELLLANNNLIGFIPLSIGNLTALKKISLSINKLSSRIPNTIGNLINLQSLSLYSNQLSDSIPSSLGNLVNDTLLDLHSNQLEGYIPVQLKNLTSVKIINFDDNKFGGKIPAVLGQLLNLNELHLSTNQLNGKIPDALANAGNSQLHIIDFSFNNLSSSIPASFGASGNLTGITKIDLSHNQLTAAIPDFYNPMLQELKFNSNQLSGQIPSSIGNLTSLVYFYVSKNKLSGNFPASFAQLQSLKLIEAGFNLFRGTVPAYFATLPALTNLLIGNNHYTFNGMEAIAQRSFTKLDYANQDTLKIYVKNGTFHVNAGGTIANNTYKWYRNGFLSAKITGDSNFTPTKSGNYTVQVTNSIATELTLYSDTISFIAGKVSNAIAASISKNNFSVYPNPAKTFTTISFDASGNVVLKLSDMNGNILQTKNIKAGKSVNTVAIDVSNYANGIYFITLIDDKKQRQTLKLQKQ